MMYDYTGSVQQKVREKSGNSFYAELALPDAFEELAPGEAARRLRESEDRLRALVAATAQLVWTMPPNGIAGDMPLWRAYTGQSAEDIAGWGWLDSVHPGDRERVSELWQYAVITCCPFEAEYRLRRYDGVYQVFLVRAVPVFEPDGSLREWVGVHTDITERKELEDAQRQVAREAAARAAELEATFEAMGDGIIVYDATGAIQHINAATRKLLAIAGDDYLKLSEQARFQRLMPRDERGQPLPFDQWPSNRLLRGDVLTGTNAADILIRTLDERDLLLNLTGSPVYGANGAVTGAVLVLRDVTEQRQLERRTRDALDALLAMAEALVQSPDISSTWEEMREPAESADIGATDPLEMLSHPDTPQTEAEQDVARESAVSKTARRLCELTRSVLGCSRVAIVSIDLATQRQHPVAAVGFSPEQERRWRAEQASAGPLSTSAYPDVLTNLRAGRILSLDLSDVLFGDAPNPFGVRTLLAAPLRIGEMLVGIMLLDHGGEAHEYTQAEMALTEAVAKLAALVIERERLLSERAEAQARELALREANRRMDDFLSIASHELRSPLTTVKANVQFAARQLRGVKLGAGDIERGDRVAAVLSDAGHISPLAMTRDLLERAERQANLLSRLVNDLLDVSRIQANELELRLRQCDMSDIVRDAVREQRLAWFGRAIGMDLPGAPAMIHGDADRLGQVVTNYLTNALKYSAGRLPVTVRLRIESGASTDSAATYSTVQRIARVEVRDRGLGLPPEEHQRIWERFHRVPGVQVQSGTGVGLGLGLHISKTIVERHGGQVGVKSALGKGSNFWFTVPLLDIS